MAPGKGNRASASARASGAGEFFYLTAAGHRLRAQWLGAAGAPDARSLVFLHQGLGSIPQWKGFPAALCQATGLPGLAYERWGFGGSEALVLPRPADHLDFEAERALPEVLDACAIAHPVLIGHSDGGTIALLHAAAFPDRVAACITEAAHVFVEDISRQAISAVIARWRSGDLRARLAKYHGANTQAMFRGWAETWLGPEFRDWNMAARLPAITCPILVIQGAEDAHGSQAQVEAISRGVSGPVETWIIPDCGHSPHLEAPEAVVARLAAFIAALPA
ncbi:MAG: alpha/beta hydrolase [Kiloniellales bacterium]